VSEPWLILETSGRVGRVGLVRDGGVVQSALLDETRRHARDLAPTIQSLLHREGLSPKDVHGVMVGIGPGSYTGLRVGVTSAKVFAYALGCRLVPVPTFRAIVERVPADRSAADVIGDALQGHVYVQRYVREKGGWAAADELRIEPVSRWVEHLPPGATVTGPGAGVYSGSIPARVERVPSDLWEPSVESVFAAGAGMAPLGRDELYRLEPLYLRGSSAEEKAKRDGNAPSGVPPG
jgi:tRNA threonylcarbamoyladenosine biosynthesis protein TsaB